MKSIKVSWVKLTKRKATFKKYSTPAATATKAITSARSVTKSNFKEVKVSSGAKARVESRLASGTSSARPTEAGE